MIIEGKDLYRSSVVDIKTCLRVGSLAQALGEMGDKKESFLEGELACTLKRKRQPKEGPLVLELQFADIFDLKNRQFWISEGVFCIPDSESGVYARSPGTEILVISTKFESLVSEKPAVPKLYVELWLRQFDPLPLRLKSFTIPGRLGQIYNPKVMRIRTQGTSTLKIAYDRN